MSDDDWDDEAPSPRRHPDNINTKDDNNNRSRHTSAPKTPMRRSTKTSTTLDDATSSAVGKALFDFTEDDNGDELHFVEGELIEILETLDDGWCVGRNNKGDVGMFPANFVDAVAVGFDAMDEDSSERTAPTPRVNSRKQSLFQSTTIDMGDDGDGDANQGGKGGKVDEDGSGEESAEGKSSAYEIVRALFDVDEAPNGDELIFESGDLIEVLQKFDDGWWFGQIADRKGYFPSNFVQSGKTIDQEPGTAANREDGEDDESVDAASRAKSFEIKIPMLGNDDEDGEQKKETVDETPKSEATMVGLPMTDIPGPPPRNTQAIVGTNSMPQTIGMGGRGEGGMIEEGMRTKIFYSRIVIVISLLLSFSLLGASIFGIHTTVTTIVTYPETSYQYDANGNDIPTPSTSQQSINNNNNNNNNNYNNPDGTVMTPEQQQQQQQSNVNQPIYLKTAKGTVSLSEGGFLGSGTLKPIPGTLANITESLLGSVSVKDYSSNVVSITYTFGGLPSFVEMGVRIEQDTSCDVNAENRLGSMYDKDLYGMNAEDDPWNGVRFQTDRLGRASGTLLVSFGYVTSELASKTLVVTDVDGIAGGCTILGGNVDGGSNSTTMIMSYSLSGLEKSEIPLLAPRMGRYPGYAGILQISGTVSVQTQSLSSVATVLGLYPGYAGQRNNVQGWVDISVISATTLQVSFDLHNLLPSSSGGLHVHTGTTCEDAGGHYFDTDREDPWVAKIYTSDINGRAVGSYLVQPGPNSMNIMGRTIVLHDADGANSRAACGVIQTLDFVKLTYELQGVDRFGLLSIHEGKTCSSADSVGGTYKDTTKFGTADPWASKYQGDGARGVAIGNFKVAYGYTLDETLDRVVIAYDSLGQRMGCGVLTQASRTSEEYTQRIRNRGGIQIHVGYECYMSGNKYYDTPKDPWSIYEYATDEFGRAVGTFVVEYVCCCLLFVVFVLFFHYVLNNSCACGWGVLHCTA